MANPILDPLFGPVGDQPSSSVMTNGWTDGLIPSGPEHTYLWHQLYEAANKSANDGIWDWEDPATSDREYNTGSIIRHVGVLWESTADSNIGEPGVGADWRPYLDKLVKDVDSFTDLQAVDVSLFTSVHLKELHPGIPESGGPFYYDATVDKSTANAGTIIDPSVSLANQGTGSGLGCWVRENDIVTVKQFGAVGNGIADDTLAFQNCYNNSNEIEIPDGTYYLTSFIPNDKSVKIRISNNAIFNNFQPDFSGESLLIPNIPDPICSTNITVKNYSDSDWGTYNGNIFHNASFVETDADNMYTGGINLVSSFSAARANGDGSSVWGANIVAYSNHSNSNAIGIELNTGVLQTGGTSYGLVVASAGNYQVENALQIQANNANSIYKNGIKFNYSGNDCVSGALIQANGSGTETSQYILKSANALFSAAEIDIPSLVVSATPVGVATRVQITASASTTARLQVSSTSTDATLQLRSKGTGYIQLADASGNVKLSTSPNGVGFHGTTPIAKPTVTGSLGGNAALASLISALESYGLIIDGTTA